VTPSPTTGRPRFDADDARIVRRFKRLGPQRDALAIALRPFRDDAGELDRRAWAAAFDSSDAAAILAVTPVTGLFEGLVNHLMEMLHAAARLVGLDVARGPQRPSGRALAHAVRDDGGLTANQADVLVRLYELRNELQHASIDVKADQLFDGIVLLQKTLARFRGQLRRVARPARGRPARQAV
jgi:hypothetical protein